MEIAGKTVARFLAGYNCLKPEQRLTIKECVKPHCTTFAVPGFRYWISTYYSGTGCVLHSFVNCYYSLAKCKNLLYISLPTSLKVKSLHLFAGEYPEWSIWGKSTPPETWKKLISSKIWIKWYIASFYTNQSNNKLH